MTISPYEGEDPLGAAAYSNDLATLESPTPSWLPVDLTAHLNGTHKALEPSIMQRTDGAYLLYPGKVHSFQGESESGKSMVAQAETARQLVLGKKCLYVDFESDAATVVDRMLKLGATVQQVADGLHYMNPEIEPHQTIDELGAWGQLLGNQYTLAIIDGVTEAFAVWGVKSIDNDEVTRWGRDVPRTIANHTGAAVVVIDHVTKSAEGRGRFAIGAQAKMSYLTGASYTVEVISPLGVGMEGKLSLRVGKDRPGRVRPESGEYRKSDRTQESAVVVIDSTDPQWIQYRLYGPSENPPEADLDAELQGQIQKALQDLAEAGDSAVSFRKIKALVRGREASIKDAIDVLEVQGKIRITNGANRAKLHSLTNPFILGDTQ